MTADLGDEFGVLPGADLEPGTGILATGPPMAGLDRIGVRFVADAIDRGGAGIVVATDRSAEAAARSVLEHATSERAADRLGVVDTVGEDPPADAGYHAASLGSPADLTGLGMRLVELIDELGGENGDATGAGNGTGTEPGGGNGTGTEPGGGDGELRVLIDSLSTLLVYVEFTRLYRFTDVMRSRLAEHGATVLGLVVSDVERSHLNRLRALFDGHLELREADDDGARGRYEYRLSGLDRSTTGWRPVPDAPEGPEPVSTTGTEPPPGERSRAAAPGLPADPDPPASLHALIETVRASGYTLTVCNHTGDPASLEAVREYLAVHNVRVRTADLDVETPRDTAILHRDDDPVAVSGLGPLRSAIEVEGDGAGNGPPTALGTTVRPDLLEKLDRREYTVENGGKRRMVRISRLVETLALDAGEGTLHAGFQELDRLGWEPETRRLYERLAATDVSVHLYGAPGSGTADPDPAVTRHVGEADELVRSWFVVFDGGGDPERAAALVSEETGDDEFTGFWTYRADVVGAVDEYLRSTYW